MLSKNQRHKNKAHEYSLRENPYTRRKNRVITQTEYILRNIWSWRFF